MGEVLIAIATACALNMGGYGTYTSRMKVQTECRKELAVCVKNKMDKKLGSNDTTAKLALFDCFVEMK